nr:VIT1/CCC1 transporter family protein [Sphingobium sp. Ant17]
MAVGHKLARTLPEPDRDRSRRVARGSRGRGGGACPDLSGQRHRRTTARALAERLLGNEGTALDTLAREELGIDPDQLGGSAWTAATWSFLLFATGAIIPVAPFLLLSGRPALIASLAASGLALALIGAGTSLFTGRSALFSAARQLVIGIAAAAVTYGAGAIVGVSLG